MQKESAKITIKRNERKNCLDDLRNGTFSLSLLCGKRKKSSSNNWQTDRVSSASWYLLLLLCSLLSFFLEFCLAGEHCWAQGINGKCEFASARCAQSDKPSYYYSIFFFFFVEFVFGRIANCKQLSFGNSLGFTTWKYRIPSRLSGILWAFNWYSTD